MAFFRSKFFIAVCSFVLGMGTTWLWMKKNAWQVSWSTDHAFSRDAFEEPFPRSQSLFDEIRRLQEQMMGGMGPAGSLGLQEMPPPRISESDTEYIVELSIDDRMDAKNFSVQVENGQLQIQGTLQSNDEGASMISNFSRTFPVPSDINADLIQLESARGKVIVHLPKRK